MRFSCFVEQSIFYEEMFHNSIRTCSKKSNLIKIFSTSVVKEVIDAER